MGSSARPYGPRRSIVFPPQNYHSQSIGSALRASPFASFGAFVRKQPKCGLGPTGLAFRVSHQAQIFRPLDVRLAVSDVLHLTPTMSVKEYRTLTPSIGIPQSVLGIGVTYEMQNISRYIKSFFWKLSGFLALIILARHAKKSGLVTDGIFELGGVEEKFSTPISPPILAPVSLNFLGQ